MPDLIDISKLLISLFLVPPTPVAQCPFIGEGDFVSPGSSLARQEHSTGRSGCQMVVTLFSGGGNSSKRPFLYPFAALFSCLDYGAFRGRRGNPVRTI